MGDPNKPGGGWKISQNEYELSGVIGIVRGLEVLASYAPITINADISINIAGSNYFLEYCFMHFSLLR